jgi:hypothetical protein
MGVETVLFQQVWQRIYNPRSGCPDIEISRVLDVMVEILAPSMPGLTDPEKRILARTAIEGEVHTSNFTMAARAMVDRYTGDIDKDGYPVPREWSDVEADEEIKAAEALTAMTALKDRKLLVEAGPNLWRLA